MATAITDMIRDATGGARTGKEGRVTAFADRIGTTPTTVGRWRDGVIPGPRWREALAQYFEVEPAEIDQASELHGVTLDDISRQLDVIIAEIRELREARDTTAGHVPAPRNAGSKRTPRKGTPA